MDALGLAKIRTRVDLGPDKSDIQTKTSYPDPIRIINRTLWLDPTQAQMPDVQTQLFVCPNLWYDFRTFRPKFCVTEPESDFLMSEPGCPNLFL